MVNRSILPKNPLPTVQFVKVSAATVLSFDNGESVLVVDFAAGFDNNSGHSKGQSKDNVPLT